MSVKRRRTPIDRAPRSVAVLRRALVRDLFAAARGIPASGSLTPEEVHDTRRRIKRARAALALLRPALTEPDYQACNRMLRSAARSLGAARDATVMTQTYARMRARAGALPVPATPIAAPGAPLPQPPAATDVGRARRNLQSSAQRLAEAGLSGRGWAPLGAGLRGVYRRGRRRRPARAAATSSEALHAWRRHTKRWWHVLELFEAINPRRLAPAIADAHRLSDLLGEEHDLALLAARLRRRRGDMDRKVLEAVADRRAKLTDRATKLGLRVYAEPAKAVERQMRVDWERWRLLR
jgi:CHAD domain-containing protein